MGKLLIRGSLNMNRKSPDAEQLLTPRKSGFFGKRQNGVRSEDCGVDTLKPHNNNKTPSARRLVTSVFKGTSSRGGGKYESDNTEDDDDKSPVDGSPPLPMDMQLQQGEPKPSTVVNNVSNNHNVTTNNSNNNNNNTANINNNHELVQQQPQQTTGRATLIQHSSTMDHEHSAKDEETVMSDLTGTVYHPTPGASVKDGHAGTNPNSIAATPTASITDKNTSNGVTFAATPHRTESFYSAYSPSLGGFSKNNTNNETTANEDDDDEEANGNATSKSASVSDYCKGTVLERVLGVVDGACHRSMDLTLGSQWTNRSTRSHSHYSQSQSQSQAQTDSFPQWGVAPSDDDESTMMDTSTFFTKGDTTTCFTRDTTTCARTHPCGTIAADDTTTTVGAAQFQPAAAAAVASKTAEQAPPTPLMRKHSSEISESELHENFELVLGQIELPGYNDNNDSEDLLDSSNKEGGGSNNKKRGGWGALMKKNSKNSKGSNNNEKEEEKKEDVFSALATPVQKKALATHAASVQSLANLATPVKAKETFTKNTPATEPMTPTSSPSNTAVSKQKQREALYQSVLEKEINGDAPDSPCRDVGVEIRSSRVLKRQQQEMAATASGAAAKSPLSPKTKGLSSLVKRLKFGKLRRTKSTSSVPPTTTAATATNKRVTGTFSNKAKANAATTSKKPTARGHSVPPSSKDKEPYLANSMPKKDPPASMPKPSVSPPTPGNHAAEEEKKEIEPADSPRQMMMTDQTAVANHSDGKAPRRKSHSAAVSTPAVERKPSRPEMKGLSSDPSVPLKTSSSFMVGEDANRQSPKSNKALLGKAPAATSKPLEDAVPMNRLRSAPVRLSSSEKLEQRQKDLKKEKEMHELKSKKAAGSNKAATSKEEAVRAVFDEDDGLTALESLKKKAPKLTWKAATDAQGRTYYYHRETRKTTWVKPAEFDAEVEAVKKYKEEMEAAKKEVSETQEVVEGYKSVEAIQNKLRKKTQRDFIPEVWQTKQEILEIVKTMPLPQGTNIEKLLIQYDGREEQLLANLRDLVESKPFDEPFQTPRTPSRKGDSPTQVDHPTMIDSNPLNISHASSISVNSAANLNHVHSMDPLHRVRTAVSASTRISEKTYLTEKTEKVRNTSHTPKEGIEPIREGAAMSTGSISSASDEMPPRKDSVGLPPSGRVPSKIPAVPRSRDLKVEEFTNDRIAKETFNGEGVVPIANGTNNSSGRVSRSESPVVRGGTPPLAQGSPKNVAEQIVAMSSLEDDDNDSYNGDFEDTVDDRATDTSEKIGGDSISALSEADVDYQAQKENFERARRRALDVAVEREDWDLAAALSEGMKQVKESLYGSKPPQQREWTQTELDRFISENDWDAVSKYIAHMRSSSAGDHISIPRGRDPGTGRDPDGFTQPPRMPAVAGPVVSSGPPAYVSEATKRASTHTQSGRRKQQQRMHHVGATGSLASSEGSGKPAQKHFGARSQLQHSDLRSISSWTNSSRSSSSDSEYTDNSYESEDEHGYISLRVRRNEFEC